MTKKIGFTKRRLLELPRPETRTTYHDEKTRGLQLRVTPNGRKTFSVYRRARGGQPERITIGAFPEMTIEQAQKAAARLNAELEEGNSVADILRSSRREMTLGDLFNEYMERRAIFNKRPDKPKGNYRLYLSHWGRKKISNISHSDVDKLHKKLARDKGQVTANIALKLLHVMFSKAIHEWRIWDGNNPAHGIKKFPEKSRDRFLQADELPRFFNALASEENALVRDYFFLALLTGARKANLLSMEWKDVNLSRAEWRIPDTKSGEPQVVTLAPEAVDVLRNLPNESTYVFPGIGKTGHLVEPKRAWTRILERAGIKDLRIHDLRRTLGSWQAKTGASLAIIGKSLNHKNSSSTSIYARLDLDPVRQSVEKATSAMLAAGQVARQKG